MSEATYPGVSGMSFPLEALPGRPSKFNECWIMGALNWWAQAGSVFA